MTTLVKSGIGVLTVGSIAVTGYVGSSYLSSSDNIQQKTKISELINSKHDYVPLSTQTGVTNTDKLFWIEIWKNYKKDSNNIFQLTNWENRDREDLTESLKVKCSSLLESDVSKSNDPIYEGFTKYCSREATVEDEAKRNQLVLIETEQNTADQTTWKSKIDKKTEIQNYLNKLGATGDNLTAETLKTKCKEAKVKKKQLNDYKDIYEAYRMVCTKQEGEA